MGIADGGEVLLTLDELIRLRDIFNNLISRRSPTPRFVPSDEGWLLLDDAARAKWAERGVHPPSG